MLWTIFETHPLGGGEISQPWRIPMIPGYHQPVSCQVREMLEASHKLTGAERSWNGGCWDDEMKIVVKWIIPINSLGVPVTDRDFMNANWDFINMGIGPIQVEAMNCKKAAGFCEVTCALQIWCGERRCDEDNQAVGDWFRDVQRCSEMFRDVQRCSEMFRDVQRAAEPAAWSFLSFNAWVPYDWFWTRLKHQTADVSNGSWSRNHTTNHDNTQNWRCWS